MARASAACQRCRRRKQKCDLKYPDCSNCKRADKPCLTYDAAKQAEAREIPRNYVSHLESQVQQLNQEIQELRRQQVQPASLPSHQEFTPASNGTSTPSEEPAAYEHLRDLDKSVRNVIVDPSIQPRFIGPSSGITLARMVMASIKIDALPSSAGTCDPSSLQEHFSTVAEASSLPPRHAADHLVQVYFQYRTPHLPIIQAAHVKKAIDNAFVCTSRDNSGVIAGGASSEKDLFISYMVFAIALCNVPSPTGGTGRPLQSEGCFRSAIKWIENVIVFSKSDIETLRAVLLLAQFASMCPWRGSLWHLTGIALRLCVDMGLHWEIDEQALILSQDLLYERRRLWYSAYQFDRVLGITLGRPFGITDESTRVPLPNPWSVSQKSLSSHEAIKDYDTHHQRAHNHLFAMSQLESEIKHVQQSQNWPLKIAHPKPNYTAWVQDIQPRLQEWFSTIPDPSLAHPMSIFANQAYWDVLYNNAILLLHRQNSTTQTSSAESLSISFDASNALIVNINLLQRDGRLDVLWKSVHDLFMAGLTIILCVWQSTSIRFSQPASKIIASLKSCTSTLSAMSVNFPGAIGCRDAFDSLSAATIDWLLTSASNVEETTRSKDRFQKQVSDLLQRLEKGAATHPGFRQSSRGIQIGSTNDISMMLGGDGLALGEMLSLAAQYPDLEHVMGFDGALRGFGTNLETYSF
ncbi:hypothetical protein M409DRAFT_30198 [Zasmidium cellare ATCC 36951]|uniref:Zn(2)-C6 fungal-type domain-containing protein n=1 Tax=Zasmidium cellare ATCC 36951 TaxID=1080233 RepID=A0A6A6C0I2_ZASCE|nr:uncharacterized protein M409DRAFT_30198 [Zasmidium cellare ATCC 36951]KAF2159322.1 hypothetical protein M409DRAFT_30198 [Zasmidium cellare ATCC 36951]